MPSSSPSRRKQPLKRLPVRVAIFLLAAGALRVLVIGGFSISATNALFDGFMETAMPNLARRAATSLEATLSGARAELRGLALDDALRAEIDAGPPSGALRAALEDALARSTFCKGLALAEPGGGLLLEVGEALPASETPLPDSGRIADIALTMLKLDDGRVAPVVSTVLRARSGGRTAVLHGVLHDGGTEALLPENPLAHLGARYLILSRDGEAIHDVPGHAALLREALALDGLRPGDEPLVHSFAGDDGRELLASAVALEHIDWIVVVETRSDSALRLGRALITRILSADMAFFVVLALFGFWISSRVVRPIESLSRGAARISQGDLEGEVPARGGNDEIGLLTQTFNAMTRKLRQDQQEIARAQHRLVVQNQELHRANEVLAQLSITDGLTKLHNHRYFQDHLTREIKRVGRSGEALSMLLADIDDFKRLNDQLGHAAGDELLVRIAQIMNATVRESDLLARYGGEEFVVLATGTELPGAEHLAEKIRTAVAETSFILEESMRPTTVTLSIGVAQYKSDRKTFFLEADRALYRAKAEGKNCVMSAVSER